MLFSQSVMAQITNPAPYCASQAFNNYNMWNYIKVEGTIHNFGAMGKWSTPNTYKYYNNVAFPSTASGATMTIELMPYAVGDLEPMYFGVFIDFNNNNIFDNNELVMKNNNTTNAKLPFTGEPAVAITKIITIPAGTPAGTHRMRLVRAGNPGPTAYTYTNTFNVGACINVNQFDYGSIYDFDIVITGGLGVNDINGKENSIEIYPNPVKDYLKISNPKKLEIKKISIFSTSGQIVLEKTLGKGDLNNGLNVSELVKGIYIVQIETSEGKYTDKLSKE